MLCEDCAKRDTCKEACRKLKAELKKVSKYRQEALCDDVLPPSFFDDQEEPDDAIDCVPDDMDPWDYPELATREKKDKMVVRLRLQGFSYTEISYHVGYDKRRISQVLRMQKYRGG